jgi:hypothetical protein
MNKPPLGIMPRKMWDEIRQRDIEDAIERYKAVDKPIPVEWAREYIELVRRYERKESVLEGQELD